MGRIIVYTDPHLGLNLKSNTTADSRLRLKKAISDRLVNVLSGYTDKDAVVCAGDFFNSYSNEESVILESLPVARYTDIILGGNHDVKNDNEKKCSLDIIREMFPDKVCMPQFGEVVAVNTDVVPGVRMVFVPHHSSQELFDDALADACNLADSAGDKKTILFLHANYACDFATQDTALNVSEKKAAKLCTHFDLVISGHDHHHKVLHDGKYIVLGSFHPTGFGDADCNRYVMEIDTNTLEYKLKEVWSAEEGYLEIDYSDKDSALTDSYRLPYGSEFVRVRGDIAAEDIAQYTKWVKEIWKCNPELFALRSDVTVKTDSLKVEVSGQSAIKLSDIIKEKLKDHPEELKLFEELDNA